MTIDLDNLFDNDDDLNVSKKGKKATPSVPSTEGDVPSIPGMTDLVIATPATKVAPPPAQTLEQIYDQYLKRVYLFDISGSMAEKVPGKETIEDVNWGDSSYTWEHIIEKINGARRAEAYLNAWMMDHMDEVGTEEDDEDAASIPEDLEMGQLEILLASAPEVPTSDDEVEVITAKIEELKKFIVDQHIVEACGFRFKYGAALPKRIELVATTVLDLIKKRFDKYPDADISAFAFDTRVHLLESRPKEKLFAEIAALPPRATGGTDIKGAFEAAFNLIKKQPSAMEMNHIIVVTDAEDECSSFITDVARKRCEQFHITVDFIHVAKKFVDFDDATVNALKALCTETKGEYTRVTTQSEFETKLIAASTRLLLPPGSN